MADRDFALEPRLQVEPHAAELSSQSPDSVLDAADALAVVRGRRLRGGLLHVFDLDPDGLKRVLDQRLQGPLAIGLQD